ncbi:ATP-binding protein [Blastococcus sp. PRF04-17]|uniref:ATP-binding protein n=1 Tax=Blastococcus sp. PRF04-17 TaxID=2933797 RepID=UPI001FF15A95|nr:ATP-binding protein [Blastococcus sp. PRF04-17]UOY00008.1 ATP-binding protein [Blastococcus sp. PRF04-17]
MSRRGFSRGREIAVLLDDFGHRLPSAPTAPATEREPEPFSQLVPRRGSRGQGRGRAATPAPLSVWRMTSEQTPVMWPLIAAPGLPPTGAQLGIDLLSGGAFYCDPVGWVTDDDIPVTNPNVVVFGKPGRGKSATVKAFALRMLAYGYRTLVLGDTKDEYEPLCRALGVEPFVIGHGLSARVNPLAFGPLGHGWEQFDAAEARRREAIMFARWLVLIRGLVGSQNVPFGPVEETAVGEALRLLTGYRSGATRLTEPTIPQLWRALDEPPDELVAGSRYADRRHFLDATRTLRDALGSLVKGSLAGLFDEHTTITVDWRAPIQSLSLSRLEPLGDQAVGIALTCLNSWGQAMREIADPGDLRIVIRDETWRQMRLGAEAMKSLDANLRLSRRDADVQILLAHKPSDMLTAGDASSQAVAIARDLLHLCDTRVLHGQDQAVGDELGTLLGLSPVAQRVVTGWAVAGKGRALWLVGDRTFQVQTVLTRPELRLTDTNEALTGGRPA